MKIITVTKYGGRPMIRLRGEWIGKLAGLGLGDRLAVTTSDGAVTLRGLTEAEDLALEAAIAERHAQQLAARGHALRAAARDATAACIR